MNDIFTDLLTNKQNVVIGTQNINYNRDNEHTKSDHDNKKMLVLDNRHEAELGSKEASYAVVSKLSGMTSVAGSDGPLHVLVSFLYEKLEQSMDGGHWIARPSNALRQLSLVYSHSSLQG